MSASIMVAIESTCLAFLLVVLTAYLILPRLGDLKKDGFFLCLVSIILGLVFDMISWACESAPSAQWLQYSSNTLCLMTSGFSTSFFAFYFVGRIREKKSVSWNYARIITIINLLGTVIVMIAAFCRKLFYIIPYPEGSGVMVYMAAGFLYDLPNYLATLSLIALFVLAVCNVGALGTNRIIVFSIYFLAPLLAGGLELIDESLQFSYAVSSICMSIVYVMLQSKHMDELLLRERLLNEWSYMDSLTNLQNRRAFDRDVEAASSEHTVSIVFCDLNGLKKVNDESGHQAGDQYLISFSEMLSRHFPHDCIYRISGDEFVVVARGISEDEFGSRVESLRQEINSNSAIAALGTAKGTGMDISGLLKEAETKMYDDKDMFYRQHPKYKRRRSES